MIQEHVRCSCEEIQEHFDSFQARLDQIEDITFLHTRKFDTLETPLWKRVWFRIDGFPGQADLDRDEPRWRPWRRWYKS